MTIGIIRRRAKSRWLVLVVLAAMLSALAASTALANLTGSTFEGGDGNLVVNTAGNTDWANVAGLSAGVDTPSGTSDNSFGQGTKEDNAAVTVVTGSIPPNKSDLTRFYEASETVGGQTLLYLAWERSNVLGSANMDFEINQAVTPGLGTAGPHTINRTAGDLLVTYDFTNGGSVPVLGLLTWVTSGPTTQCFSSNSLPCWGNHVTLNSTNSEGAINTATVTDPIPPNAPRSLVANTFGEAAINLTGSGVFAPGVCKAFGSTFLKSRSSASFTAEVKDFVAPVPVNISNCGKIIIRKVTSPSPDPTDTSFSYTTTGGLSPAIFSLKNGGSRDYGSSVPAGSYSVTESDPGPNFALSNLDCSASDLSHGSTATPNGATVSISLNADDTIDCTFTNTLKLGAIKITKKSTKGNSPLAGATFEIKNSDGDIVGTPLSDASGVACVANLLFGDYSVKETSAPSGYKIDDSSTHSVTVNATGTCSTGTQATTAFSDTPLSQIRVTFHSKAGVGVTTATIQCTGDLSPSTLPDDSTGRLLDDLAPGTYSCTVVVDP